MSRLIGEDVALEAHVRNGDVRRLSYRRLHNEVEMNLFLLFLWAEYNNDVDLESRIKHIISKHYFPDVCSFIERNYGWALSQPEAFDDLFQLGSEGMLIGLESYNPLAKKMLRAHFIEQMQEKLLRSPKGERHTIDYRHVSLSKPVGEDGDDTLADILPADPQEVE